VIANRELPSMWRRPSHATLVEAATTRPTPRAVRKVERSRDPKEGDDGVEGLGGTPESRVGASRRRFTRLTDAPPR
jgi:hypothetical protein